MSAKVHAEPLKVATPFYLPAWVALFVAVAALAVGIVSLQTSSNSGSREAAIASSPWVGVDMDALKQAGYTGRLGAITAASPYGEMDREDLIELGFTGRLSS